MRNQRRFWPFWATRLAVAVTATVSLSSVPALTGPVHASVHGSCTLSRCSDAASANSIWSAMDYPATRGWHDWPNGKCNFSGGEYQNRERELPSGDHYHEYDVYPRSCGAARDAYRIVVDSDTGKVSFSPNHYNDFYQLQETF